ncbi:putative 4.1 G protein [Schistosoma mansoni]|uniref:putative 4.1 G protein n=1 Tax=Schistosoma mansoni TaxID=6183 RepID=UPI00022DC504|nr:putative 4.1 G protein [Schistosoma mansoni]|eukprot:XP_018653822.1 putative 4.1 G protein [Schistosoma mansoni]
MEPPAMSTFLSDNETVGESTNLLHLEGHSWSQLQDGTIEITDRLPKKEYYMSLRRFNSTGPNSGTAHRLGSISSGSAAVLANGSSGLLGGNSSSPRPGGGTLRGSSHPSIVDFKPSGKIVDCTVVMLDGTTREFRLDKAAYGQQLLDAVCTHLGLLEVEFFGITYYDSTNNWFWLQTDQRIAKQIENEWQFEFQVKFYPCDIDSIKEDITRYYLCLQVRQDIVSGHGKTPEEADRLFLNNARQDITLGVYYGGILLYRNRIRLMRISWPRIISLSHRGRNFIIARRPGDDSLDRNMTFKCISPTLAKRLYNVCVDHHNFFRLRGSSRPKKPSLFPSFATRKYHYPGTTMNSSSIDAPVGVDGHNQTSRPLSKFRPMPAHPSETGWFTFANRSEMDHMNGAVASQYQYQPAMVIGDPACMDPTYFCNQNVINGLPIPNAEGVQRYYQPSNNDVTGLINGHHHNSNNNHINNMPTMITRISFEPEHWRITGADCTAGLGIDARGLDVASTRGAGWQGCRANKGVKAPGAYYYEAACLEEGLIRVGWSTNDANLELGADNYGFGYGSDAVGSAGINGTGRVMHRNSGHDYGIMVHQGDVIGCLLDLDKGSISWSCNGKIFRRAFTIPDQLRGEAFLPAASLKDSRILFNFGEEQPLEFPPDGPFIPVAQSADDSQVSNRNPGWRMNQYDATNALDVAPDGSQVQSHFNQGWQGCRSNHGIRGLGRFYFEVTPIESTGLWRVGWSTDDGNLIIGTDQYGFGYGADNEGFGLNGQQGKRIHCDEIENYGEAFSKDDVIGCFLDTIEHTIKWSKNGLEFGDAYQIPSELLHSKNLTALYPTVSLLNSTVELNFGDKPFKYYPGPDWTPVCCAPPECTKRSRRKGPERKVKGWSYIDPTILEPSIRQTMQSIERSEPQIETETFHDENGKMIKRIVKRSEVTTTKTVSERIIASTTGQIVHTNGHPISSNDFDEDLNMALLTVTKLDPDISVLNNPVGQVEIGTKSESVL